MRDESCTKTRERDLNKCEMTLISIGGEKKVSVQRAAYAESLEKRTKMTTGKASA